MPDRDTGFQPSGANRRARLPQPERPPGARGRDRLHASAAVIALLAIIVGVPVALVLLVGSPIPTGLGGRGALTNEIDSASLFALLSGVVWLAWAHFVACVIAEGRAELKGNGLSPRVPFGGGSQALARRLVATTLLFSGTAILVAPTAAAPGAGTAAAGAPGAGTAVTRYYNSGPAGAGVLALPAGEGGGSAGGQVVAYPDSVPLGESRQPAGTYAGTGVGTGPAALTGAPVDATLKYYEVKPAEGRHYDTLWGIAERFLSDGLRYREIFTLNEGRVQPDGRTLTKPSLIHPGWVLLLPADARGEGLRTVQMPAPAPLAPGGSGSGAFSGPSGADGTSPDSPPPGADGLTASGAGSGDAGSGGGGERQRAEAGHHRRRRGWHSRGHRGA